jgi:hypothetical protein
VRRPSLRRELLCGVLCGIVLLGGRRSSAQDSNYERTFHQSKTAVEKALKQLQPAMSGRLPILDGFATTGEHPLSRFRRGYYQSTVQVSSTPSGVTVVRVSTKITAWYADPSHSGYQVLSSNGRIEGDLLDQLSEQLITTPSEIEAVGRNPSLPASSGPKVAANPVSVRETTDSEISAPMPQAAGKQDAFSSALKPTLPESKAQSPQPSKENQLEAEVMSLEEALKNQAHPKNIVAVKKSGTPVVASASLSGKTLFLASMHDEFEMIDFNRDWVHVRISGLSRGWIWRDSLEMPEGIPDNPQVAMGPAPSADLFQVTREEKAPFPGDWGPLRGKYVKVISVQEVHESAKDAGPSAKLEFAKFVLDKNFAELSRKTQELFGIVLIFDSTDGGMIAATFASLERWKSGKLSDAALWHQCFFDPPETFMSQGPSTSGSSDNLP